MVQMLEFMEFIQCLQDLLALLGVCYHKISKWIISWIQWNRSKKDNGQLVCNWIRFI